MIIAAGIKRKAGILTVYKDLVKRLVPERSHFSAKKIAEIARAAMDRMSVSGHLPIKSNGGIQAAERLIEAEDDDCGEDGGAELLRLLRAARESRRPPP